MDKLKERFEIEDKYKWNLSKMFESDEKWDESFDELSDEYKILKKYETKILASASNLYETLENKFFIEAKAENLYVYAYLKKDEDITNIKYQEMSSKISNLYIKIDNAEAYIFPEILKSDYSIIEKYIDQFDDLKKYSFLLENLFRNKKHILSEKEEKILNNFSNVAENFEKSTDFIVNSEIKFDNIIDEFGNIVELCPANYSKYAKSLDRRVRKEAYESLNKAYGNIINALSSNFIGQIKFDELEATLRNFNNSLEEDSFNLNIDSKLVYNLLEVSNNNTQVYQKYLKLLKKNLNVENLEIYDLTMPLSASIEKKYTYEEAKKLIVDSLDIYGKEYLDVLKLSFDNNWIDVMPNKNKSTGWYSYGSYLSHPVILGNFNAKLDDVSALAHELGHSVHHYFNIKENIYPYGNHSILEAEIASLTNEIVFSLNLMNKSNDKNEKLSLCSNMIDLIASNFFSTTSAMNFLLEVHDKALNNKELTSDILINTWKKHSEKYYKDIVKDKYNYKWARTSHFYMGYYYYKYATGVSIAIYNAINILSGNQKYIDDYISFLKIGGKDYPINNLKLIGVDLNDSKIFEKTIEFFDSLLDQFEAINNS
ncbi:MAG: oligoendopeptidase F family protein [Bacilli bacterium]|nr:oligoendopeptidase F family protein [Bacilli bacterium]